MLSHKYKESKFYFTYNLDKSHTNGYVFSNVKYKHCGFIWRFSADNVMDQNITCTEEEDKKPVGIKFSCIKITKKGRFKKSNIKLFDHYCK